MPAFKRAKVSYQKKKSKVTTLRRLMTPDVKQASTYNAFGALAAGGTITLLSGLSQGDSDLTRDGPRVFPVSMKVVVSAFVSSASAITRIRVAIIQDKASNGAAPAVSDIYESATNAESAYRVGYEGRFTVLADQLFANVNNANDSVVDFQRFIKLATKPPCSFIGTGATVVAAGTNHYYLVVINEGAASTGTGTGDTYDGQRTGWVFRYYD